MPRRHDITGQPFGKLTAVRMVRANSQHSWWECRCECGGTAIVTMNNLRRGNTTSCGCAYTDHGMTDTPEHEAWVNMIQRCTNPKNPGFANYRGRGITVCQAWLESFVAFLNDVGMRPGPGYSLERKENDGNYEPGNVEWIPAPLQHQNKRTNRMLEIDGVRKCMAEWARIFGRPAGTIHKRLKLGWDVKRAVTEPSDLRFSTKRKRIVC